MSYQTHAEYRVSWDAAYYTDPAIPLNVDIELASACNAKCTFCLYGDKDWREDMNEKDWDGKVKKRFMSKELALRIIDECAKIGVPALKMNFRGESTMHKDYREIMEYAAKSTMFYGAVGYGGYTERPSFFEILVNTNGNLPHNTTDHPTKRQDALTGLMCATKVMISLDSMDPDIYPKVRVGLDLSEAQKTISDLVELGHPDLWVRRVVCKDNQHEDFVGAVKSRWPKCVRVSEHSVFERNHYQNQALYEEDTSNWERTFCGYPAQRVVIEASGRYSACCIAWAGELSGGTYPAMSIMQYWNSPWRKRLADNLRKNVIENDKCKNCTSYMAFKRPERDFVKDVAR